ncbi:MAG: PGPGW domain-containing protein [Pseudomonadota bacterium]
MPSTRLGRLLAGTALIIGGILGFLPVLGFWMIPLGLFILSQDFPAVRRFRRKWTVRLGRCWLRLQTSSPRLARLFPASRQRSPDQKVEH